LVWCSGVYYTDSVYIDLGIDHSGAIRNNDLVVAVQRVGTFENHVSLGFARSGDQGALVVARGRQLGPTPNTPSVLVGTVADTN